MCDSCSQLLKIYGYPANRVISNNPSNPDSVIICQQLSNDARVREILMYQMLTHPHIPTISEVEITRSLSHSSGMYIHYTTKRLVKLVDYITDKELASDDLWDLFLQIASVVTYLCLKVVSHQYIRPGNVMVDEKTGRVYLTGFGYAGDTFTVRGSWVDPAISKYYYEEWTQPPCQTMIGGNVWSLGMLGIWMFIDDNIYDWLDERADDETIDIAHLIENTFRDGLEGTHLDLSDVDPSRIELFDRMMGSSFEDRIWALKEIQEWITEDTVDKWGPRFDMSRINHLNSMEEKKVLLLEIFGEEIYPPKCRIRLGNISKDMKDFIETIRQTSIWDKDSAVTTIRAVLDKTEKVHGKVNKSQIVYLLYDEVLPECYEYIQSERFWTVTITKLDELNQDIDIDFTDLIERRRAELIEARDRLEQPTIPPVVLPRSFYESTLPINVKSHVPTVIPTVIPTNVLNVVRHDADSYRTVDIHNFVLSQGDNGEIKLKGVYNSKTDMIQSPGPHDKQKAHEMGISTH